MKNTNKLNLDNVTLVAVAGVRVEEAYKALKKSIEGIEFNSVKLITPKKAITNNKIIEIVKLENELNYEAYNKFIVYNLKDYIDTDYVLLVQDDGFVAYPSAWRNEFFNYDYIGAIWPQPDPNDKIQYRDPFGKIQRVGNGGFSFRSKKLLETPTKINLEWKQYYGYWNEDGFLCCHNRHLLEEAGLKYAPMDVAKYFSHECEIEEIKDITPFGFHGKLKQTQFNLNL